MAQTPQTLENHVRLDPIFHYFLLPVSFLLWLATVIQLVRRPNVTASLLVLTALILVIAIFKIRTYSLKVQDRVIRLEERLRLQTLCSDELRMRSHQLTESQWTALRFASDQELAALAAEALDKNLSSKAIKARIQTWRPDYFRV